MSNPTIPSEADIEAAEKALEELRTRRREAEAAATNKAALMAAFEAAIDAGRFELVNGELVDAHASRSLTRDEKFILALARGGRLKVTELTGTKVVLDEAIGDVQKPAPKGPALTDDQKLVVKWMSGPDPRVRLSELGGQMVVFDNLHGRQRGKQKRMDEAKRTAAQAAQTTDPTPAPGAGDPDPQPNQTVTARTTSAPTGPQPVVAGGPNHDPTPPSGPRRRVARRTDSTQLDPDPAAPSGAPSQAPGYPVPAGAGYNSGGPYGPPPAWQNPFFMGGDPAGEPSYPPAAQPTSHPEPTKPGGLRKLGRRILGDYS